MSANKFNTVFERDEAGFIYAHVPKLPEVQTQGRTLDEAREMARVAIGEAPSNLGRCGQRDRLARSGRC